MKESPKIFNSLSTTTILLFLTFLEALGGLIVLIAFPGGLLLPYRISFLVIFTALLLLSGWGTWRAFANSAGAGAVLRRWFESPTVIPRFILGFFVFSIFVIFLAILWIPDPSLKQAGGSLSRIALFSTWIACIAVQWGAAWWIVHKKESLVFPPRMLEAILLLAVFLASLAVRIPMTGYGLPYQGVWDEVVTYPQALRMFVEPGLKPAAYVPAYGYSSYGDLLTYITFAGETVGYFDGMRNGEVHSVSEFVSPPRGAVSIYEAVHPSGIPLRYPRLLIVLINCLAPVFIFFILRKYFRLNAWLCFGASVIYAVLSREVIYYSSYILPDALAATFTVILLWAAMGAMQRGGKEFLPWLGCGILAGVVISINIRNIAVLLIPIIAFLLAWKKGTNPWLLPAVIIGAVAGFALTSPYSLIDFPSYLRRISSLQWNHDTSLSHRLSSLVFYIRGAFAPGFQSAYVNSTEGSAGVGIWVGILALLGIYRGILRCARKTLLLLAFSAIQFFLVLSVVENYTRHILILYPLFCLLAGNGLALLAELLRGGMNRIPSGQLRIWGRYAPAIVLVVFLALHAGQLRLTAEYVQRTSAFRPSQTQAVNYLKGLLQPGDIVGLQAELPFVEEYLTQQGISFRRVSASETISELRAQGITYVIGTDRLASDYLLAAPVVWEGYFHTPGSILASFGKDPLEAEGFPCADLYLFVGRIPGN